MNILFVDEEDGLVERAKEFLENTNSDSKLYTTTFSKNEFKILKEKNIDVIIASFDSQKNEVLDLAQNIRDSGFDDIPFIIITKESKETIPIKALNLGIDRCFVIDENTKKRLRELSEFVKEKVNKSKTKEENRRRDKKYRSLLNQAAEMLFLHDTDGNIVEVNQSAIDNTGYSRKELLQMNVVDIDPDAEERGDLTRYWKKLSPEDDPINIEAKHKRKDGSIYPADIIQSKVVFSNEEYIFALARDITERKKAQRELEKEKNRRKVLLDNIPGIALILEKDTREIVFSNEKAKEVGAVPGKTCYGTVAERDDPCPFCLAPELWETDERQELEVEYRGTYYHGIWVPYTDDLYVHYIYDITELKEKENALKESEKKFRTIFENSNDPIIIHDLDGEIIDANERSVELIGLPLKQIINMNIKDLAPKADRNIVQEFLDELKDENSGRLEREFRKETGNKIHVDISARVIDEEGERVQSIIRDITERKKAENKVREAKEKIEELHKKSTKLLTCESEEEVFKIAVNAVENILDFDICSFAKVEDNKIIVKERTSGLPEGDYLERPLDEGGIDTKTYLNQISYLIKNVNQHEDAKPVNSKYKSAMSIPIGEYGVFQAVATEEDYFDEDDLNTTELLINDVTNALKRIEMREKEEFLHSLLRHDVRNKSVLVQGYLDLAEDFDLPEEVQEYIQRAKHVTNNGIDIIDKVKKLRTIEEKSNIRNIKIKPLLIDVISDHEEQLKQNEIKYTFEAEDYKVKGGSLLDDLFSNILENSIKHSKCDKINIEAYSDEDECIITIEDDGKGIEDKEKDKIFDKGYRLGEDSGTGLGMYIVREIAQNYNGKVEVKDSDMGGARFDIHLKKGD